MEKICRNDLQENIVTIKINKSYREGMSALELYDVTRGCWKRSLKSVENTEYAFAVVFGIVKEVYRIDKWFSAEQLRRETIVDKPGMHAGRIAFEGKVANDEIRSKYVGKSVSELYKQGEADPIKVFLKNDAGEVSENTEKHNINGEGAMFDKARLKLFLEAYKKDYVNKIWVNEQFKWKAVKCFQDNWDDKAEDFLDMLKRSLAKTESLLIAKQNFPGVMIQEFAEKTPDEVRSMFVYLFDESKELSERMEAFKRKSSELLIRYKEEGKQHFQNENAISIYLWLRYPDKYYIYKYGEIKQIAYELKSNLEFKKGAYDENVKNAFILYDGLRDELSRDEELVRIFKKNLTEDCYEDHELHTLTIDFGFYISRYYTDNNDVEADEWWPSTNLYSPGFTKEEWLELLNNREIIGPVWGNSLAEYYDIGGEATCTEVGEKYGRNPSSVSGNLTNLAKNIHKKTDCPLMIKADGKNKYWPILFMGKKADSSQAGNWIWKLRPELYDALTEFDILRFLKTDKGKIMNDRKTCGLNTILYGPPGTGKTRSTIIYAVAIIEKKSVEDVKNEASEDYDSVKKRFDSYMGSGQIGFTTFHQAYGYEEFIEGIKPVFALDIENDGSKDIKYDIAPGVFKKFCENAGWKWLKLDDVYVQPDANIWKVTIRKEVLKDCFDNDRVRIDWDMDSKGASGFVNDMVPGDVIITTDGSRSCINGIAKVVEEEAYELDAMADKTSRKVVWLAKNIDFEIVDINGGKILHRMTVARVPQMKFESLIPIIRFVNPKVVEKEEKEEEPYVFIIDEINRGNISKIFGELITLIENGKRIGDKEEVKVVLPYSQTSFGVPGNVYILGTMNTADRSIALIDTALRRRFDFIEMMPDIEVIKGITVSDSGETLDVAKMLDAINRRIEYLYDREHTIGHAYFTGLKGSDATLENLAVVFKNKVIPLLQEYFYEDYEKIQLVLGDNDKSSNDYKFILDNKVNENEIFKKSPQLDLREKTYEVQDKAFNEILSYIEIYETRKAEE